jgi:hypothetical protein
MVGVTGSNPVGRTKFCSSKISSILDFPISTEAHAIADVTGGVTPANFGGVDVGYTP